MQLRARPVDAFRQRRITEITPPDGRLFPLTGSQTVRIKPPPFFGVCRLRTLRDRPLGPRWLAEVRDAVVHAPTFAVTSGSTLWQLDDETRLPYESAGYSQHFEVLGDDLFRLPGAGARSLGRIRRAALVSNRASENYFHLAFDILPKLLLMESHCQFDDVTMILDSRQSASTRELLHLISGTARPTVVVGPGQSIQVSTLTIASACAYLPDDPRLDLDRATVDPAMIRTLAKRLRPSDRSATRIPLLWVSRRKFSVAAHRNGYVARDIENSGEINTFMSSIGGVIIEPENMTLSQQREHFASADIVAMAAGSACVNLLFCRPGTSVLLLSQDQCVNPGLLAIIADALQLNLVWLFGPAVPGSIARAHWNFLINPSNLRRALDWMTCGLGQPDGTLPMTDGSL